jgi:hypothetical protein
MWTYIIFYLHFARTASFQNQDTKGIFPPEENHVATQAVQVIRRLFHARSRVLHNRQQ